MLIAGLPNENIDNGSMDLLTDCLPNENIDNGSMDLLTDWEIEAGHILIFY